MDQRFCLSVRVARVVLAVALLWPLGPVARGAGPPPPVGIVLVHGILNTGQIFDPMIRVLGNEGHACLAPSLTPNDCRRGVHDLALKLSAAIDARFGKAQPVILVGFSMGGLITRDYVQNIADRRRIRGVFLISVPNHGTLWASLARRSDGIKDLSFNSRFVQALNHDAQAWQHIPVYSYWTPYDLMILPATSSRWTVADPKTVFCLLHPWMVTNQQVTSDISARIAVITAHR